ncbi:MAG: efflux RND transporter periplasmic adaptor subunit [Rikenellaceae bacterium]
MKRSTLTALLLLAASTATSCHHRVKSGAQMPPLRIEVATSTTRKVSEQIWFATSTEAIRSVTIEPRIDGYLRTINYRSGMPVSRGDLLFTIDPTQIETALYAAEASLESAKASLVEARNNYERAIPMAKIDAISQSSLDQYTATYRAAQAEVKSAEQTLRNAELNLSYATITSPIDGVVAATAANEGDFVGTGTLFSTLTTVADIDTLNVNLAISASKYLKYVNTEASYDNADLLSDITLILPDSSLYPYPATYDYTEQSAASGSSSVVIVANIPNPDLTLKAGIFARLRANIGAPTDRVMIPQRAVTQMQGSSSVWVIQLDSTATYRRVTLGNTYGDEWHVVSGVESGESVATTGQIKLHEGSKVIPSPMTTKLR